MSAMLQHNLERLRASDPFGSSGRAWLAARELPVDECPSVGDGLCQFDFLGEEPAQIDRLVAVEALSEPNVRCLLTVSGLDVTIAVALVAVIGDVSCCPSARHLVGDPGLVVRTQPRRVFASGSACMQ